MRKHLSREDQLDLFDTLNSIVLRARAINATLNRPPEKMTLSSRMDYRDTPILVRGVVGGVNGIPILRRLDVVWFVVLTFLYDFT